MPLTGYFEPSALTATAINTAAAAAKAAGGGTVWLGNGRYTGNTTITFDPNCVSIEGADAVVDYSARTGNFIALTADSTNSDYYKRGMAHSLRGWVLRGNSQAGSVGAYFNTPLGAHVNSTVFNTENFVIERFGVNLDIGDNCFICTFRGISLGYCVENHIRRLNFANNGENMSFFGGALYNGGGQALRLLGQNQEWRFVGTSFDYNKQICYTDGSIEFHTCHFEASAANLSSLQSWQGVFEGDNGASLKFFGGEIGLTNTQITNIDHMFKSWGANGMTVEFHGIQLPSSLHYKVALCNDMTRIVTYKKRAEPAKSLTINSKKIVYSDFRDGNNFKLLATSDFYLPNPTNAVDGQEGSYWIKQDPTGNKKLLAIGDKFLGEPITLSTTANYEDRIDYKVTDDNIEYKLNKRTNTMIAGALNPIMLGQIETGATDPNTLLLLHFDGANGSTTFTDSSQYNRTLTPVADAQITTAHSVFGGSGFLSNTANSKLTCVFPALGTGDFTFEFLYKPLSLSSTLPLFQIGEWGLSGAVQIYMTGGKIRLEHSGLNRIDSSSFLTINTFVHVAAVRTAGNWTLYLDGVNKGAIANTVNITRTDLRIAGDSGTTANVQAAFDELRISDIARYTANFTPPSAPFAG